MLKLVDISTILDISNSIYFIQAISDILDIECCWFSWKSTILDILLHCLIYLI